MKNKERKGRGRKETERSSSQGSQGKAEGTVSQESQGKAEGSSIQGKRGGTEKKETCVSPLATEKISKLLGQFALPSIVAMLVSAIYNIVD